MVLAKRHLDIAIGGVDVQRYRSGERHLDLVGLGRGRATRNEEQWQCQAHAMRRASASPNPASSYRALARGAARPRPRDPDDWLIATAAWGPASVAPRP